MPDNYFARYLPFLIHMILAGGVASAIVTFSWMLGQRNLPGPRMSPYECGMTPVGDARQRFSVKFYLVAMLFILFDVEAVFIYPWAVILRDLKISVSGRCWYTSASCWWASFTSGKRAYWTGVETPEKRGNSNGAGSRNHRSRTTEGSSRVGAPAGVEFGRGQG